MHRPPTDLGPRPRPTPRSVRGAGRVALRCTGNHLQTAVWTLAHPVTGRTVTLVGTMHIADPAYFHSLSELLAGLAAAGAEVHVEGIARRADCRNEWEEDRLAEADSWADAETTGAAVKLLALESQSVHLHLPEGTRNIDLSHAELLRRVGWDNYRRLFAAPPEPPVTPGFGPVIRAVMRFQLRHSRSIEALRSLRSRNRRVDRVVIGDRNRRAFEGAMETLVRRDVVLIWGTEHLPGLARLFTAAGFRLRHEAWFEACVL